jgi:hypothetical protein
LKQKPLERAASAQALQTILKMNDFDVFNPQPGAEVWHPRGAGIPM